MLLITSSWQLHTNVSPGSRELFRTTAWSRYIRHASLFLFLLSSRLNAQVLPAGTTLAARLTTPTGSRVSHTGDQVEATIIAPISFGATILVPQRSRLIGTIDRVKPFGLGLRQITATIHYQFHALRLVNGETVPIHSELIEVDTAKERVAVDGTVRGIHPAASVSSSLALFTVPLLFLAPAIGVPVWGVKSMIAPSASPEIYFPVGTEIVLRLTAPAEIRSNALTSGGVTLLSTDVAAEARHLLSNSAQRARMGTRPSDLVNMLFFGSRGEMERAFRAAGWFQAERKSPMSLYRMYHALTKRIGYRRAPMNTLTLNGARPDVVYQKSLDTVQKRHHVRFWRDPQRSDVWMGAAAEDIGFRFEWTHWTHSTAPKIDNERAKVVNDMAFTGCLDSAMLMPRNSAELQNDSGGERAIVTDSYVAAVRLNDCTKPNKMPGAGTISSVNKRGRLARGFASLGNDLRLNVFFTTYNALKPLIQRRSQKPLRDIANIAANPPGLQWLSSLSVAQPLSERRQPEALTGATADNVPALEIPSTISKDSTPAISNSNRESAR